MSDRQVIAVDLGAESGRVAKVGFDGSRLHLNEVHRFPNIPVRVEDRLYWDVLRIWHEITTGIDFAGPDVSALGVDSWGVDIALLDRDGRLLANPLHYRDTGRTDESMNYVFERVPRRMVFERTGIQFMVINGLYELANLARANSPLLDAAGTLLTIVDLFNYWLSGSRTCEFTHLTTVQVYNPRAHDWDRETLGAIGVPLEILPEIVHPGTQIGTYNNIPVITPACHDTGSAVVAVPTTTHDYAYLSSGTWSLLGVEVNEPIINDAAYAANVTNEGGVGGTYRLLKNVMGLWLAQQCRATWQTEGMTYDYAELTRQAVDAEPFRSFVDPDDLLFLPPGDMPGRIREFCQRTNQPIPETVGQVMRTVYESLALKYRYVLDKLIALSGHPVERLHIIGGGTQNLL
ncbi:MAG: rhamnulokinase, partial [Chloroflexi bacterium]|nr:rhamnulokinase [Chloroflexota bacterium]